MKKILVMLTFLFVILLTGCENIASGNYKEGTYFGSVEFDSYGKNYVTTAVVYVDETGTIKSVFIDSTYIKDDINTTKKVLGDDYGMKETSASKGEISGGAEWYEQLKVLEDKIITEQGIDWVKWQDDEKLYLDGISGVTITADTYIDAVRKALEQAK